jgi:hypothetical protein
MSPRRLVSPALAALALFVVAAAPAAAGRQW